MRLFDSSVVAIVTGGGRGIGRATAKVLATEGAKVVVNFNRSAKEAEEVVRDIQGKGGEAIALKADVSHPEECQRLVEESVHHFGSVDVLINNAGSLIRPGDWKGITDDVWQTTMDINLKSAFNMIRLVGHHMLEQKRGRIVNISSTYGIFGAANVIAYVAAKAGVIALTKSFAKELAPYVTVNAVAPGHILTDLTPKVPGFVERISAATPLKRLGEADEAAWVIAFLASDRASFITGQIVAIDGGHILK
jgi:3-oxoacyl-[acyl-carrier protein] reductase